MAKSHPLLPFNRVVVSDSNEAMSAEEFVALPLDVKIGYILSRRVEFYNGAIHVDRKVALASLRAAQS